MVVDPPVNDVALFYPVQQEMLKAFDDDYQEYVSGYIEKAGELRCRTNYDICDTVMIADGFLRGKRKLVFVDSCMTPKDTIQLLKEFHDGGGDIVVCNSASINQLETGEPLKNTIPNIREYGEIPEFPEYESRKCTSGEFVTVHENHITRFMPDKHSISVERQQ